MKADALFLKEPSNGIIDVPGFEASGVSSDIRGTGDNRLDTALIYSSEPCQAAGVFTRNDLKAAPVLLCMDFLSKAEPIHAIIANSGNANACTGNQGMKDAQTMAGKTAKALNISNRSVLVCSTGRIGKPLPMANLKAGIIRCVDNKGRNPENGQKASQAILTSDTCSKVVTVKVLYKDREITLAGMAKGAGMIQPDMATMLAFIATDANITKKVLHRLLVQAVGKSFNRISIDGDMSTNDTVILLANGVSAVEVSPSCDADLYRHFQDALDRVCAILARKIVVDGERITRVVDLQVKGAPDDQGAEKVARAVANSLLVKTSWFGADPNWGRLADAAGYARVGLQESLLNIEYDDTEVLKNGQPVLENLEKWKEIVSRREFQITIDLNLGFGSFNLLTTDLSVGYVEFNKSE